MALEYLDKSEAEKLAKVKLDGRRKYFLWDGIVCVKDTFRHECSGCDGAGCRECGGKGVRIGSFPCPVNPTQVQ